MPPVGFEPTLAALLGGPPLPLGYGGALIIPPMSYMAVKWHFGDDEISRSDSLMLTVFPYGAVHGT